jgi:organic hydroperoxide reductase OsmC/OhrA
VRHGVFNLKEIGMAHGEHKYQVSVQWTGNRGSGTSGYRDYGRDHTISAGSKPDIPGSSDPAFLGDATRWNPEDLLVASASACHKLWYLHLCSDAGIAVLDYHDRAEGTMVDGAQHGQFTRIVLHPHVTIRPGDDRELAERLHHMAHEKCYIANSVNFPIVCEPSIEFAAA